MTSRLLYVVGQLEAGGLERQLHLLLRHLDRERYRPAVAVWSLLEEDTFVAPIRRLGIPICAPPERASAVRKLAWFSRLVRSAAPEVVHSYSFYTNLAAHLATRGTAAIAVGSVQSDFDHDVRSCGPLLGRASARWPRHQVFVSHVGSERAGMRGGLFTPAQRWVVPCGIDLARFVPRAPPVTGTVRLLAVGVLSATKRWDRLLRVVATLERTGRDLELCIVGDGPERADLERQARALGVERRVVFLGRVDDDERLVAHYAHAAFVVHTSDIEGCPNVVLEAMACGRPVVATDAGDVPRLVLEGQSGFVVRRGDDAALCQRVAELADDPSLRRRMGDAARARAERMFGAERLVTQTLDVYRAAGWRDA